MKDLKESDLNKRDEKALYKNLNKASNQTEINKEMAQKWIEVKDEYLAALIRCPYDPYAWLNDEYPRDKHEIVHKIMMEGKLQAFEAYYENAKKLHSQKPVFQPVQTTLNDYVDHTGIEEDQLTCLRLVISAGHGTILREITRLLFGPRTKERTLWISGAANSGKTKFIQRLNEIFASDEVDWKGLYLPVSTRTKPKIERQILSSEEFSFEDAFAKSNRAITKQLMEGRGANVR